MLGEDQVQGSTGLRVVVIVPLGLIPATAVGHLFSCQTEQKESSGRCLRIRVLTEAIIEHYDPKRVQQLPLVFMYAFDLTIEDTVRVYFLTGGPREPIDKVQLRLAFSV